jgi:hypothetical protein
MADQAIFERRLRLLLLQSSRLEPGGELSLDASGVHHVAAALVPSASAAIVRFQATNIAQ